MIYLKKGAETLGRQIGDWLGFNRLPASRATVPEIAPQPPTPSLDEVHGKQIVWSDVFETTRHFDYIFDAGIGKVSRPMTGLDNEIENYLASTPENYSEIRGTELILGSENINRILELTTGHNRTVVETPAEFEQHYLAFDLAKRIVANGGVPIVIDCNDYQPDTIAFLGEGNRVETEASNFSRFVNENIEGKPQRPVTIIIVG